jgi:hypothetical protein
VPLIAPFIRARLRFSNGQLIVGLSALSAIGLVATLLGGNALVIGYFTVGVLRIFLMPVLLGFAERNLGATAAVFVLAGGYHLTNAILKPGVAWLVEQNLWRYGLAAALVLVTVSAVTARLTLAPVEGEEVSAAPHSEANPTLLGKAVIAFVGIQVLYGLRELAVFNLAGQVLGSPLQAGTLEGIAEAAMFMGCLLTPLLKPKLLVPMLSAQVISALMVIAAIKLHHPNLLYTARIVEGLSYAVLERLTEVLYLGFLGGLPQDGVAYQWIDSVGRVATVPGRMVATAPAEIIFAVIAVLAAVTLLLVTSPVAGKIGSLFYRIAERPAERRQGKKRLRFLGIILIINIKVSRVRAERIAPALKQPKLELLQQLRSSAIR